MAIRKVTSPPGGLDRERYELIGRISSGLAHELNGPIGIAIGFTELSKELIAASGDGPVPPSAVTKLREYLGLTESATLRARTLAKRISAFAKLKPGEVSDFDLTEALEEAAALAAPAVKIAQIEIGPRTSGQSAVTVHADRALCVYSFVRLFMVSPEALAGGGSVAWEASPGTPASGGHARFVLVADPWGEAPSAAWPISDDIRAAFQLQGGAIGPSSSRKPTVGGSGGHATSPSWELPGWLPAIAGAVSSAPVSGNVVAFSPVGEAVGAPASRQQGRRGYAAK